MVGFPHDIKGQGIYAFVTLNKGVAPSEGLKQELEALGSKIHGGLSQTRTLFNGPRPTQNSFGKNHAPNLRKNACNDLDTLGDISTLADPGVVKDLMSERMRG